MVRINGELDDEVLPEVKGKRLPAAMEDKLIIFLWPRCITRQGGSLRVHSDASGGLHRRRKNSSGLGFPVNDGELKVEEELGVLEIIHDSGETFIATEGDCEDLGAR
jgi:hypothetical protein